MPNRHGGAGGAKYILARIPGDIPAGAMKSQCSQFQRAVRGF